MSTLASIIDADVSLSFAPEVAKAVQAFFCFISSGVDIQGIFDIEDGFAKQDVRAAQIAYLKSIPEVAQIFEERYIGPTHNVEELIKLPKDSLGYAYAYNLREVSYPAGFYPKVEILDDVSYYSLRMRQTHDIWHTVSGYGLTLFGGIGITVFQYAQNRDPVGAILLAGDILNNIKMQRELDTYMLIVHESYNAARQAKPFLAQKWEEAWEKPLAEWRAELNVAPVTDRTPYLPLTAI
ncbi:Coq4 family protein [Trichormus sp. NMC-1]|uniref:Coq4 family protein n=1 Tax=Trichormus sp. NMC-1 TaxID=1853259 RepID=UPI0008DC1437|nr:Coq4 family protein [Trichormus sp. NMC-1]